MCVASRRFVLKKEGGVGGKACPRIQEGSDADYLGRTGCIYTVDPVPFTRLVSGGNGVNRWGLGMPMGRWVTGTPGWHRVWVDGAGG